MTWTININGHDDLKDDEKVAYEAAVVEMARTLVSELAELDGGMISTAWATTNTTGQVDLFSRSG